MKKLEILIQQLNTAPEKTKFSEVIDIIENFYHYTPSRFTNGSSEECVINEAGENEGSCKIFSFAQIHQLNESQTLHCFAQYYRNDVLNHPENTDHGNIRTFIKYGWNGIHYDRPALEIKAS